MSEKKNDFLELVKKNPNLDKEDLRILLEKRIEKPFKFFLTFYGIAITVFLGVMTIQWFHTLPGLIYGTLLVVVWSALLVYQALTTGKKEIETIEQYAKAKESLTNKPTTKNK
jgi:hypothetical protein